jgi:hypothetical protein
MLPTSTHRTPEETKNHYISQMGDELGSLFYALWQEVVWLHVEWHEFVQLFGTKPARIAVMNDAAPQFFRLVRDELLDMIVLRIARLSDPPKSTGKSNLTIQQLPARINEESFRHEVVTLIDAVVAVAKFCRDRRHRRIAHRALDLSLGLPTQSLPDLTRENITAAIEGFSKVLNAVGFHYLQSTTEFGLVSDLGGAVALIRILDDGVQKKMERITGLKRGELPADNIRWQRL